MTEEYTDERLEQIKKAFQLYDRNGDGFICTEEMGTLLLSMGKELTQSEIQNMIQLVDTNGNGKIDLPEFMTVMKEADKRALTDQDQIINAFKVFDKDGNNYLTATELRTAMTKLGEPMTEEEVDLFIKEADINEDGMINYHEFVQILFGTKDTPVTQTKSTEQEQAS